MIAVSALRSILFMVFGMGCYASNDLLINLLKGAIPTGEIITIRAVLTAVPLVLLVVFAVARFRWRHLFNRAVVLRSLCEMGVAFCFVTGLGRVNQAELTALILLSPVFSMLVGFMFLGEKLTILRTVGLVGGLGGMVLILQPGLEGFQVWSLFGLGAAFFTTVRDYFTHSIPREVSSFNVAFATTLAIGIGGLGLSPFEDWFWPDRLHWPFLIAAAGFVFLGNYGVILAFRQGMDMGFVSLFRFSIIVWALLFSVVIFGAQLNLLEVIGIALVTGSGLVMLKERRRT